MDRKITDLRQALIKHENKPPKDVLNEANPRTGDIGSEIGKSDRR
jgi:hypothetical protein